MIEEYLIAFKKYIWFVFYSLYNKIIIIKLTPNALFL